MSPFPAEPLNTASSGSVSGKWEGSHVDASLPAEAGKVCTCVENVQRYAAYTDEIMRDCEVHPYWPEHCRETFDKPHRQDRSDTHTCALGAGHPGPHYCRSCKSEWTPPAPSQPQESAPAEVEALWDESLALAFHDAIDGDYLVGAGGAGNDIGINRLRVSEVVRWATKAVLASEWLADRLAEAVKAERDRIAAAIEASRSGTREGASVSLYAVGHWDGLTTAAALARTAPLQDAEEVGE